MTPPVHAVCDHCEKQGTLYHTFPKGQHAAYLCPEHRAAYALVCAAGDDLRLLVKQACLTWLAQWGHLSVNLLTAPDELQCMADEIMTEAIGDFRKAQQVPQVREAVASTTH